MWSCCKVFNVLCSFLRGFCGNAELMPLVGVKIVSSIIFKINSNITPISPNAAFFLSMSSFLKLGNDDFAPVYFRSSAAVFSYIIDDFFVFRSFPTTFGKFQVIPACLFINVIWRFTSLQRFFTLQINHNRLLIV